MPGGPMLGIAFNAMVDGDIVFDVPGIFFFPTFQSRTNFR